MKLAAVSFYVIMMFTYILFSRQPDWFDGEFTNATVIKRNDSLLAVFNLNKIEHTAPAKYLFRDIKEGEKVKVIYEASQPSYATVYSWWGYWIRWQEILFSLLIYFGLYKAATSITNSPAPESLIDQLEGKSEPRKRRYDD